MSFQMLTPLIPVYGERFSSSESEIGILVAAISLAALFMRPFAGIMADRYNCNRIIMITQLVTGLVIASYIIVPNILMLTIMRFAQGLMFGLCATVIATASIRAMPEDQIGRGIGILGITGIGSQAIAPMLGLWLVESGGYPAMFLFTAVLPLIASAIAQISKLGTSRTKAKSEIAKVSPKDFFAFELIGLVVLTLIMTMAMAIPANYIVVFANAFNIPNVGFFFTIYAATLFTSRLLGSNLIDKYSYTQLIPLCAALCAVGLWFIGFARSFPPLVIAAILIGIGFGIAMPAIQTKVVRSVAPERRGTANATYFLGMDIAYVGGPIAMGFIAEASAYNIGFYCFAGTTVIAIPLTLYFARKKKY